MNCPECDANMNIPEDAAVCEIVLVEIVVQTMKSQRKKVLILSYKKQKQ